MAGGCAEGKEVSWGVSCVAAFQIHTSRAKRNATARQPAQQRATRRNRATKTPRAARPQMAAVLFLSSTRPIRHRMNPSGAATKTASPPRAETEDCQPGRKIAKAARLPKATKESNLPIRPRRSVRTADCLISGLFMSAIVANDLRPLCRFANGGQAGKRSRKGRICRCWHRRENSANIQGFRGDPKVAALRATRRLCQH
jgi:hypothetical protein